MDIPVKPAAARGTRAGRRSARTRRALLDAARGLCAERGYQAVTVADIAEAADVGVGTFYYHFETKDDVLVALMERFMGRMATEIARRREQITDPVERLRHGFRVFFTLSETEQDLLALYYHSAAARESFTEAARQFFAEDTLDTIRTGQAVGVFRGGDPELLAQWLIGASSEAVRWMLASGKAGDPGAADLLADLMLRGLQGPGGDAG